MTDNISADILTHAWILSCSKERTHMSLQAFSLFYLKYFIYFVSADIWVSVCIYTMCVAGSTKYVGSPVNRIAGSSNKGHGCKKLHSGTL